MKENDIKNQILSYLAYRPGLWWRNNTGAFLGEHKGRKRFFRYGLKGSADILGVRPPNGQMVAIETKVKGKRQRPEQKWFQDEVQRFGGVYILAYDVEDVRRAGV